MNLQPLVFTNAPTLSDETVSEMRSFLYELIDAYERQYGDQLQRFQQEYFSRMELDLPNDTGEDFVDDTLF